MALPLHDRAVEGQSPALVRLTENGLVIDNVEVKTSTLLPGRVLAEGEQYRFHFDMTKCIGCRSCEVACNEQNGNPADITWRRVGELEGGTYPDTQRHYLSMGCNHCLDADCLRGCPVNAYTKDVTGIVLHSADACIGCSYCVWNCPYSVPQFNPERGVVGKCDMCKGRLDDGLEPACVNACPEGAIEIEIVNMLQWRGDFAEADSPGMPAAKQTISTTRITLPEETGAPLERVDMGQIQPEHAHMPLVFMTTMMQAVSGALWVLLAWHGLTAIRLGVLLGITAAALTLSTLHLGRPAYAYRALKMWRRSWLSREVLLFTLFFGALAAAAAATGAAALGFAVTPRVVLACDWAAAVLGLLGTLASAAIYLVKARPAWNMHNTPLDFVLTGGLLGSLLAVALETLRMPVVPVAAVASLLAKLQSGAGTYVPTHGAWLVLAASLAWAANQGARTWRLRQSTVFEAHAAFSLLSSERFRPYVGAAAGLAVASVLLVALGHGVIALAFGAAAVLLARYLFFVTVVPLNMALTFVRSRHA